MIHYSVHFFPRVQHPVFRKLRRHHMNHHFRDAHNGFGVSSPLWDRIFRT
jgi:sterol desaturase/sphingolipid hydroxylase (fatty acid hydroxylase superfamily)